MGRLLSAKAIALGAAVAVFLLAGAVPLGIAIVRSLSIENYAATLGNARTWILFGNSIVLGVLTAAFAGIIGVGLAILFAKTDLPLRNALTIVFSLPLLFPPYILAVGWFETLGHTRWFFGMPGGVLVLGSAFLPVVLLLTMTYLRTVNQGLEEAARLSFGWSSVLRRITLPLITPGILLSLILVFVLTIGEFGAPSFLRVNVFAVASLTQLSAFYDFGAATAAAMPLVLVAAVALAVEQRALSGRVWQFRWNGAPNRERIALGRSSGTMLVIVLMLAMILVGTPIAALVWRGLSPEALSDALDRAGTSAVRSLLYSGAAAFLLCTLGFLLGYIVHTRSYVGWRWLDSMGLFFLMLPPPVIGTAMIATWNTAAMGWIYPKPAILILAYIAQYSALSTRIVLAGFSQISPSMEEAAEIAGAGWSRRMAGIVVPLSKTAIVSCWTLTFIFCMRDVALSLLLAPPGRDTLTARTLTLMANGSPELIAALCLLSIALALIPLGIFLGAQRLWSRAA
jgi:iron(III) transport system permease protein